MIKITRVLVFELTPLVMVIRLVISIVAVSVDLIVVWTGLDSIGWDNFMAQSKVLFDSTLIAYLLMIPILIILTFLQRQYIQSFNYSLLNQLAASHWHDKRHGEMIP